MSNFLYDLATDKKSGLPATLFKFLLYLLSLIYGILVRILIFLESLRPKRLNCKVISVGNITLGGTGKTSLVESIARYLGQKDHKVAILSRGYKRPRPRGQAHCSSYETMGDEPFMLCKKLKDIPVLVDNKRIRAADEAVHKFGVDTIILDDGFQQWHMCKDLEIVTIDATDPFGNQRLIPRGILRQPISSLSKADILVLTKTNLNPDFQDIKYFLTQINPDALIVEAIHKPVGFYRIEDDSASLLGIDLLKGRTVTLVCGIADPDSFEDLITSLKINAEPSFRFPDHYHYTKKDLDKVIRDSKDKGIDTIITTEKDAVRFTGGFQFPITDFQFYVLRIRLEIIQDEIFTQRIHSLY